MRSNFVHGSVSLYKPICIGTHTLCTPTLGVQENARKGQQALQTRAWTSVNHFHVSHSPSALLAAAFQYLPKPNSNNLLTR